MQTVLITGANRGIGLALARHYFKLNFNVIGVCRHSSEMLNACTHNVIDGIDLNFNDAVKSLSDSLSEIPIDLLISNAGILQDEQLDSIDFDSIERQFQVNALGSLRLVSALQANLSAGSKIALITSRMGSIEDNTSGGRYGYRMSKAALNAAGKSMAHDLKGRGVAVAILHPGLVSTAMINFNGQISPEEAAKQLAERIEGLNLKNTGTFWHANGDELPW
ncbi:MAG: SDR family oxidoreductase [Pseudomonadota bacterium]|nr:SDR family oxidoreductase [Pseudomonadota bacterium]